MARYIGPKAKISRKFGEPIFGVNQVSKKRKFAPGQHGPTRRAKSSEYEIQLKEKQKWSPYSGSLLPPLIPLFPFTIQPS